MIGFGYDSHRFERGNYIVVGGLKIDCEYSLVAHSDGDALVHSIIDALLGAAALGDIGEHFPDNDPRFAGIDSTVLLKRIIDLISEINLEIVNIDASIVLEKPKLNYFKTKIKKNLASICKIAENQINIKAKSNEKMGFIGRSEGIACYAVCQLKKKESV
ncbi:MAG: 2-C-methyl-D-erythritol 2,4-cyclodiphosphate synthase [Ignavibacteria bacterium]|nr:2-C-methyl-D-erythritol 2,4-cyclodiphosphate synthase [Ignavibacteria bacterium]